MKLYFRGADHEVTGSCHVVEVNGKYIMLDCGMEQGKDVYENAPLPVPPSMIDAVLLSHAHIDHSGMLPKLCKDGYAGPIYCTKATKDLCSIMLLDSAHIQEQEAEWKKRKAKRAGKVYTEPEYTVRDAERCLKQFRGLNYHETFQVTDGVTAFFTDAGHILGSSFIHLDMKEGETEKKLIFSGDIGNPTVPILKDPEPIEDADYVIMESTYGDRLHEQVTDQIGTIAKMIQETFDRGGNFVVPCFAVGRTQEMLYFLREIVTRHLVTVPGGFNVYVDSPLAAKATEIFEKNEFGYYDEEAMKLIREGTDPIRFEGLMLSETMEESKAINSEEKSCVILSASGMCEAGRIRHHLKHNLWRSESTICFAGYQAEGTLGRRLLDGEKDVTLFGEEIHVNARIEKLQDVSSHADREGLIDWLKTMPDVPSHVFVVHGDDLVAGDFAELLQETYGYSATAPYSGSIFDLAENIWVEETVGIPIHEKTPEDVTEIKRRKKEAEIRANQDVYDKLAEAGEKLMHVIEKSRKLSRSDLKKFTKEVIKLVQRWK